jgi:hypothetical protein
MYPMMEIPCETMKARFLPNHFSHPCNNWNNEGTSLQSLPHYQTRWATTNGGSIIVEQMTFNDKERETCDGIESIKNQGR